MKILITGITGTLGKKVSQILLAENPHLTIYGISRDEQKLRSFPDHKNLHLRVCDIRDPEALEDLLYEMSYVNRIFHFAALKCVDTLETHPMEAVLTNVIGTRNVLALARKIACYKVIFTSTDKAVYPINAYGQTKALAEKLVLNASESNVVCRYGNILGSRGSFLPALIKSLIEDKTAPLTHQNMTRFWMTIEQVARFVIDCGFSEKAGIQVPKEMKSSKIVDLIEMTADILKVKNKYLTKLVGIRAGEKMHEYLETHEECEGVPMVSSDCLMEKDELRELLESAI